jgi:hypothetical protein
VQDIDIQPNPATNGHPRPFPQAQAPGAIPPTDSCLAQLAGLYALDNAYRETMLSLVASENYPSAFVRLASAARHSSFYFFPPPFSTPPGEWGFHASGAEDVIADEIRQSGDRLFGIKS